MSKSFRLRCWVDDGWFVGRLRECSALMSQGETLEQLQANIRDTCHLMVNDAAAASPAPAPAAELLMRV